MIDLIDKLPADSAKLREALVHELNETRVRLNESENKLTQICGKLSEVDDTLTALSGAARFLDWFKTAVTWAAGIAGAGYTFWLIYQGKMLL